MTSSEITSRLRMLKRKLPIEDPIRISKLRDALSNLRWEPDDYLHSTKILFDELGKIAQAEIEYYYSKRISSRKLSKYCRVLAWLLGGFGILVPLLQPILGAAAPSYFLSMGYLAFGFAGVVLLGDSIFSGTQAHHRYTETQLELEHLYTAFALRWQRGIVEIYSTPSKDAVMFLVDEARAFCEGFHDILGTETVGWKRDMDEGLAQLKGKVSANST